MAIIISVIVALSIIWMILIYNQLVKEKNLIKEAWSGIDVQLKRRHNLIPALVKTVKAYSTYERKLFSEITEKRTKTDQLENIKDKAAAETGNSFRREKIFHRKNTHYNYITYSSRRFRKW